MSAGLAVVWQVSLFNKFCWIWSSGVVINTLKFSWMKRTCDVSKVFLQIESLEVDIESLKYQKASFWLIIRFWYKQPKFIGNYQRDLRQNIHCTLVVITIDPKPEGHHIESQGKPMILFSRVNIHMFCGCCKCYVLSKKLWICIQIPIALT